MNARGMRWADWIWSFFGPGWNQNSWVWLGTEDKGREGSLPQITDILKLIFFIFFLPSFLSLFISALLEEKLKVKFCIFLVLVIKLKPVKHSYDNLESKNKLPQLSQIKNRVKDLNNIPPSSGHQLRLGWVWPTSRPNFNSRNSNHESGFAGSVARNYANQLMHKLHIWSLECTPTMSATDISRTLPANTITTKRIRS